jgi:hypothetical protein
MIKSVLALLLCLVAGMASADEGVQILQFKHDPVRIFTGPTGEGMSKVPAAEFKTPVRMISRSDRFIGFQDPRSAQPKQLYVFAIDAVTDEKPKADAGAARPGTCKKFVGMGNGNGMGLGGSCN